MGGALFLCEVQDKVEVARMKLLHLKWDRRSVFFFLEKVSEGGGSLIRSRIGSA